MSITWKCSICGCANTFIDKECMDCGEKKLNDSEIYQIETWRKELMDLSLELKKIPQPCNSKWNYLQLTSDDLEKIYGGLNGIGYQGWELVGISNYEEGGGLVINGTGGSSYKVKTVYIFKRPSLIPDWFDGRLRGLVTQIPEKFHRYLFPENLRALINNIQIE